MAGLDRKRGVREIVGGHPLKHDRGAKRARNAVRDWHELPRRYDRHLGIGPGRHGICDAVARPHFVDTRAHGFDEPRGLSPEGKRSLLRIEPRPSIDIDEVDPYRLNPHERFARPRLHQSDILVLKRLRAPRLMHPNSFHSARVYQ